jgi:hypothetical protein
MTEEQRQPRDDVIEGEGPYCLLVAPDYVVGRFPTMAEAGAAAAAVTTRERPDVIFHVVVIPDGGDSSTWRNPNKAEQREFYLAISGHGRGWEHLAG